LSVQAKRWDQWVDRSAIDQAIAGMSAYGCTGALVITNSVFTGDAFAYGRTLSVALWDQKDLANFLEETGVGEASRPQAPACPRCHVLLEYKKGHPAFWGCPNYRTTGCRETAKYHHLNLKVAGHRRTPEVEPTRRRLFDLFRR
jgi:ssDNA-binding Zn-finger/Zn-ribbon topoisomerase 1